MKKRKMLFAVCSLLLCCFLLSGCLANAGDTVINEDGSGSCTLYTGFEEQVYNEILESMKNEGMTESDDESTQFTYNGRKYIGEVVSFNFDDIEELNETLMMYSQQVETGIMEFSMGENGDISFSLTTTENTGNTTAIHEQANSLEPDEEAMKQLEEIAVVFDIEFPSNINRTEGLETEGIVIDGNKLHIDYIKLAEKLEGKSEKFTFVSETRDDFSYGPKDFSLSDVTEDCWFYEQVTEMVKSGLIKGKGDNLFHPNDTITKAEFITVASKLLYDKPALNLVPCNPEIWWDKYYDACINSGIFTQEDFSYSSMTEGMERQEMALVVFGLIKELEGYEDIDTEAVAEKIPDFSKVKEEWRECVAQCYDLGILCGDETGAFNPEDTLTRA